MPVSDASPAVAVERALNILEAAAQRRMDSPTRKSAANSEYPKAPRATSFEPSKNAAIFDAKRKPGGIVWLENSESRGDAQATSTSPTSRFHL